MAHNDVTAKIELLNPVGTLNEGFPLIIAKTTQAAEYAECTSLEEVVTAGFAAANGETPASGVYQAAAKMWAQKHAPKKIAVCGLTAITAENLAKLTEKGWRQLVVAGATKADAAVLKTYIAATNNKMMFAGIAAVTGEETAIVATDYAGCDRIVCVVHGTQAELAAAAVAGEVAGNETGSITYKNLIINGITPENLTTTQLTAIHTAKCITILQKAGDVVTSEGFVTSGEYADIIDCKDYIISKIEYDTQKVLNSMGKVPYDNRGIAILENVCVNAIKTAYNKGMIAVGDDGVPMYSVSYTVRADCDAADIAARNYVGGRFAFTLAGAIHEVQVTGEISVV